MFLFTLKCANSGIRTTIDVVLKQRGSDILNQNEQETAEQIGYYRRRAYKTFLSWSLAGRVVEYYLFELVLVCGAR